MKPIRYSCQNCGKLFNTGKFDDSDSDIYDNICPNCGAVAVSIDELLDKMGVA